MAPKKPNPMLAQFEARLEAGYKMRLKIAGEMSLVAAMRAIHNVLNPSQDEAGAFQNEYAKSLNEVLTLLVDDSKDDPDLWYTKDQIEQVLRTTLGDEKFEKSRHLYRLLLE